MKIILLVVDSLRADAPGYAGGEARTPTLDRLAAEGCHFPCVCSGSWTVPSVTSMMTGRWPHRAAVCNWRHGLPDDVGSLASALHQVGVRVEACVPYPKWWFAGWPGVAHVGWGLNPAEVDAAVRAPGDRLVVVHHWNTHFPYLTAERPLPSYQRAANLAMVAFARSPDVLRPRFRALYRRAVEHWSEQVLPRVLDAALSGGEDVLVAITADHGENWGEALPPGRRLERIFDLHGRWMVDATVRVPLLFWGSGVVPGARGGLARGVDVGPTLAAAGGLSWPYEGDGRALPLGADAPAPDDGALTVASHNVYEPETYPADGRVMWRRYAWTTDRARWTWDSATGEREITGDADPDETALVWARLAAEWAQARDAVEAPDRAQTPEEAVANRLRALGYLDGM